MILELADLDVVRDNALKKLEERLSKSATPSREAIERETARLESQLEQLYSFTALMARREPDVIKTAELWGRLAKNCDLFAARVFELSQRHSLTTETYDSILDIRSSAEELRALHSP